MVKLLNKYASYGPLNVNFELQKEMKRSDNIDSGLC